MAFNNIDAFIKRVKQDIIKDVAKNAEQYSNRANNYLKDTIEEMEAVDTGFLQSKSFIKSSVNISSNDIITIQAKTQAVPYAVFVVNGLGTNRKYGVRNYLLRSLKKLLNYIRGEPIEVELKKGSPFKGGRKVERVVKTGRAKK